MEGWNPGTLDFDAWGYLRKTKIPVGFSTVKSETLCKLFRFPEVSLALWEGGP